MKGIITALACAAFFLPAIAFSSCAGAPPAAHNGAELNGAAFSDAEGREWFLSEIRRGAHTIRMDRRELSAYGFDGIYSIHFEDGRISGMGAPNRFFGPYTVGGGGELAIGLLGHTMMMALAEPADLREHEYFAYLSRVTRWNLREGRLELYTSSDDGSETVFVFAP